MAARPPTGSTATASNGASKRIGQAETLMGGYDQTVACLDLVMLVVELGDGASGDRDDDFLAIQAVLGRRRVGLDPNAPDAGFAGASTRRREASEDGAGQMEDRRGGARDDGHGQQLQSR
jgi:hypothetical protein